MALVVVAVGRSPGCGRNTPGSGHRDNKHRLAARSHHHIPDEGAPLSMVMDQKDFLHIVVSKDKMKRI